MNDGVLRLAHSASPTAASAMVGGRSASAPTVALAVVTVVFAFSIIVNDETVDPDPWGTKYIGL